MGNCSLKVNQLNQSKGTKLQHNQFTWGLNGGLNYTTSPTCMFTFYPPCCNCEATTSEHTSATLDRKKKKKRFQQTTLTSTLLWTFLCRFETRERREKRGKTEAEQSTFNYSEYPCGVIAACCSNNQQSLFSLPTMKAADAAASLPSYSLCPQSLSWSGTSEKTCKVVHFFQSLQQERIVQEMPSKSDSKWPGKERKEGKQQNTSALIWTGDRLYSKLISKDFWVRSTNWNQYRLMPLTVSLLVSY